MSRGILVYVALIVAVASLIGIGFWYSSTQPSRVERIVACVDGLGYSADSYHDDGKEHVSFFDLSGDMQVRPPSDHVIVKVPGGKVAEMTVTDNGDPPQIVDHGAPLKAGEHAAIIDCAA